MFYTRNKIPLKRLTYVWSFDWNHLEMKNLECASEQFAKRWTEGKCIFQRIWVRPNFILIKRIKLENIFEITICPFCTFTLTQSFIPCLFGFLGNFFYAFVEPAKNSLIRLTWSLVKPIGVYKHTFNPTSLKTDPDPFLEKTTGSNIFFHGWGSNNFFPGKKNQDPTLNRNKKNIYLYFR